MFNLYHGIPDPPIAANAIGIAGSAVGVRRIVFFDPSIYRSEVFSKHYINLGQVLVFVISESVASHRKVELKAGMRV